MTLLLLLSILAWAMPASAAFSFYTPFTVQTGQVTGTISNFPVLLLPTDARFKSTGNGGNVQSTSGFDIRPHANSSCTSALTYQLVMYTATSGFLEMWVNVPSLADGSVIYLCYGDSSLTSDGSSTGTWDTNFRLVYHAKDGTTLDTTDSSTYGVTLTNHASIAAAGQIDGALRSDAGTDHWLETNITNVNYTNGTISWWQWHATAFNSGTTDPMWGTATSGNTTPEFSCQHFSDNNWYCGWNGCSGDTRVSLAASATSCPTASTCNWPFQTWVKYDMTWTSGGTTTLYMNNTSIGTHGSTAICTTGSAFVFARVGVSSTPTGNHAYDEFRLSDTLRDSAWLSAEYKNQSAPGSFTTLGTEQTPSVAGATPRRRVIMQ